MLVFPEGASGELVTDADLRCESEEARRLEWQLRFRVYGFEHFQSHNVVEENWIVNKKIRNSGWGLEPKRAASPESRGAWHIAPVIETAADLKKLRHPVLEYEEAATLAEFEAMNDLFGDILQVELRGVAHISYHLMAQYTAPRGLEEVMVDMYAEPEMLRYAMAFLEEGHHGILRQCVEQNLLSFNNDNENS